MRNGSAPSVLVLKSIATRSESAEMSAPISACVAISGTLAMSASTSAGSTRWNVNLASSMSARAWALPATLSAMVSRKDWSASASAGFSRSAVLMSSDSLGSTPLDTTAFRASGLVLTRSWEVKASSAPVTTGARTLFAATSDSRARSMAGGGDVTNGVGVRVARFAVTRSANAMARGPLSQPPFLPPLSFPSSSGARLRSSASTAAFMSAFRPSAIRSRLATSSRARLGCALTLSAKLSAISVETSSVKPRTGPDFGLTPSRTSFSRSCFDATGPLICLIAASMAFAASFAAPGMAWLCRASWRAAASTGGGVLMPARWTSRAAGAVDRTSFVILSTLTAAGPTSLRNWLRRWTRASKPRSFGPVACVPGRGLGRDSWSGSIRASSTRFAGSCLSCCQVTSCSRSRVAMSCSPCASLRKPSNFHVPSACFSQVNQGSYALPAASLRKSGLRPILPFISVRGVTRPAWSWWANPAVGLAG